MMRKKYKSNLAVFVVCTILATFLSVTIKENSVLNVSADVAIKRKIPL